MRCRIAYFLWHFPVPSETFVLNELRELVKLGYDVRVFCRHSPHKDFKLDFPIEFECITTPEHLADRLAETKRTIVHSHFTYPTVTDMVWPACQKARISFTFIPHAQDIFRYSNDEKNRIGEVGQSKWCLRVFVPSRFHKDYVIERGVPTEKIVINPNGIDASLYASGRVSARALRQRRAVCAIHRYTAKKGLSSLIQAGKLLEQENIAINIFGYGDLESDYRSLIEALKITNVFLGGRINDRQEMLMVFRNHDLFACPSVRAMDGDMDGIPTVLMEAMAAGLPVFASAISGIPDLVIDGKTGLICDPTPEGAAECIRRFYGMPEENVRDIVGAARKHVERNFNTPQLTQNLLRVWHQAGNELLIRTNL